MGFHFRHVQLLGRLSDELPPPAVGYAETLGGRFIPAKHFQDAAGFKAVADAVIKVKNLISPAVSVEAVTGLIQPIALQIYSTGPPNTPSPDCGNGGSCVRPELPLSLDHSVRRHSLKRRGAAVSGVA